jgi:hypothetical protein
MENTVVKKMLEIAISSSKLKVAIPDQGDSLERIPFHTSSGSKYLNALK